MIELLVDGRYKVIPNKIERTYGYKLCYFDTYEEAYKYLALIASHRNLRGEAYKRLNLICARSKLAREVSRREKYGIEA